MRNKLALFASAAIIATLTVVATPGVSAASENVNWSAPATMPNAGTSATPAMTECNGLTYMVWKGLGNDTRMFYSALASDGVWAPQQVVGGGGGTNTAPTVACDWREDIVVAWKGLGGDEHIYYTIAQVESSVDQPLGPLQWSAQRQVDGGAVTDLSPSLAVTRANGGTLYLAWKGTGADLTVHVATLPQFGGPWRQLGVVPGTATVRSPTLTTGLAVPQGEAVQLFLLWPQANSQAIMQSSYAVDVNGWSGPAQFQGGSGAAPAATEGAADGFGPLDDLVAWQGSGNDTRIFYTVNQNASGWQPQQVVTNAGPTTNGLSAADYVQCPDGHCTLITAYLAWEGPQGQLEFVHGVY